MDLESQAELVVPLEDELPDTDSSLGDDNASLTTTANTTVFDYKYENGRRYHGYLDGKYPVPNDESEVERLDLQHHMFLLAINGKLHLAPLPEDIHDVLDVGCGTGAWSIAFADAHPSARVQGVDLSPIQPVEVPPNCSFIIDDVEAEWIYDQKFDFILSRAMVAGFHDWPRFFRQAFANLKPGGYLELQDFCFPPRSTKGHTGETSKFIKWSDYLSEATQKVGFDFRAPLMWQEQLAEAGFEDIHVRRFAWPLGPWAKGKKEKIMGEMALPNAKSVVSAGGMALLTRILGWKPEDAQAFFDEVREELVAQKVHLYSTVFFCYARKPTTATTT